MQLKKLLLNLLKFGVSAGILTYVVMQAQQDDSFAELRDQPKNWGYLLLACLLSLVGVMISFYRWYLLVRALGLPFRLRDAFRLGFLGYLLNFVSVGSVGGDLFKAVFIAREQHGHRTEAVATVIIDRVVGLYSLVLVAAAAVLLVQLPTPLKPIADTVFICAAIGGIGGAALFLPALSSAATERAFGRLPVVGMLAAKAVHAVRLYRNKPATILASCLLSIGVHSLTTLSYFSIALALPGKQPTLGQHFVIVPIGVLTGILPLPLGALGALEGVMRFLYLKMADSAKGVIVTFGYRAVTILLALVGACYYLSARGEVSAAMHEAEELPEDYGTDEDTSPGALSVRLDQSALAS